MKKSNYLQLILCFMLMFNLSHADSAKELVDILYGEQSMAVKLAELEPKIDYLASTASLDEDEKEKFIKDFKAWFNEAFYDSDFRLDIAALYREAYTNQEIEEILSFYRTPVGQKMIREQFSLEQRSNEIWRTLLKEKGDSLKELLQPFVLKKEAQPADVYLTERIPTALLVYKVHMGDYPTTEEGLRALVEPPDGKEDVWKGPYLKELHIDQWGNAYSYRYSDGENSYDLRSLGPDGVRSSDDITN